MWTYDKTVRKAPLPAKGQACKAIFWSALSQREGVFGSLDCLQRDLHFCVRGTHTGKLVVANDEGHTKSPWHKRHALQLINTQHKQVLRIHCSCPKHQHKQVLKCTAPALNTYTNKCWEFTAPALNTNTNKCWECTDPALNTYTNKCWEFTAPARNTYTKKCWEFTAPALNTYTYKCWEFKHLHKQVLRIHCPKHLHILP